MKFVSFLLPLAVSAAVLDSRQLGGSRGKSSGGSSSGLLGKSSGGGMPVVSTKTLTPEITTKKTQRKLIRFGPLDVKGKPSGKQDSGQINFMKRISDGFCRNCTVLKGRVGIENTDGTPADPKTGVYIHHILTFDSSKRSKPFVSGCGAGASGLIGSKFIGTGEDNNSQMVWYTARDGSSNSGFHLGSSPNFMTNIVLVNYGAPTKVYLTFDVEYIPGTAGSDATETLLSVTGCGTNSIKISNTGPTQTSSGKFTFTQDGEILLAKGHLHAGGEKMVMNINGKTVCESKAVYGGKKGEQAIDEMSICSQKPIKVKKGDSLTFSAHYDVSKHPVRHESHGAMGGMPDIMGMFDVVFAPTR